MCIENLHLVLYFAIYVFQGYQALRSEVLVQHAEQLLTEMDLNSLLPEESTDDSGTVDRALSLVETALAAKQDVVQQLGKPVKEVCVHSI